MRVLLNPVVVRELGVVMFRPGPDLLPHFSCGRILLENEPDRLADLPTGEIGEVNSNIVTLQHAQASTIEALAEYQTQTTATFQEQQAAINEKFTAYANATTANAIYTLKTGVKYNGNYYDAGLSVAVIADGSGVKTRVAINADQLVMLSGQGQYSPFAIVNGQVFLSSGFIQDGTITNAKIGSFIQSNNYQAGVAGWRLDKGGALENYGSNGEGAMKQTNTTISIRDQNRLRVQIGWLTGLF